MVFLYTHTMANALITAVHGWRSACSNPTTAAWKIANKTHSPYAQLNQYTSFKAATSVRILSRRISSGSRAVLPSANIPPNSPPNTYCPLKICPAPGATKLIKKAQIPFILFSLSKVRWPWPPWNIPALLSR